MIPLTPSLTFLTLKTKTRLTLKTFDVYFKDTAIIAIRNLLFKRTTDLCESELTFWLSRVNAASQRRSSKAL